MPEPEHATAHGGKHAESHAARPADTPPTPSPADGRARLLRALRHPGRAQWVVAVLLALVGLAAVVVMRTTSEGDPYANMRQESLINVMEGLTGTTDRARREIADLEETKRRLQEGATSDEAALVQAQERVQTLDILAGRIGVQGPGVRVLIEELDPTKAYVPLIDLVQEFRTAGAEALVINDKVRIIASTSFGTDGSQLTVDGVPLPGPYVMEAIGGSARLSNAVTFRDGPKSQIEELGGTVQITELERLAITAVAPGGEGSTSNPPRE